MSICTLFVLVLYLNEFGRKRRLQFGGWLLSAFFVFFGFEVDFCESEDGTPLVDEVVRAVREQLHLYEPAVPPDVLLLLRLLLHPCSQQLCFAERNWL